MPTKFTLLLIVFAFFFVKGKAQNYMPNVSKDSLSILKDRAAMLKASLKLYELKIKESEEEADVEKLRIKLIAANADAKQSAAKNNDAAKKIASGGLDAKTIEKIAKKAKDDMEDSQRALDAYNKQIRKVEAIRNDIKSEEEKLNGKKPIITYNHK